MTVRDIIKRLARIYMLECGDTPRQAMKEACAFIGGACRVIGNATPSMYIKWADERMDRIRSGNYHPA